MPVPGWQNVPYGWWGYQQARSGNAYCEITNFTGCRRLDSLGLVDYTGQRSYLQTKLTQKLISGVQYSVTFYIVNANFRSAFLNSGLSQAYIGSNGIGANLSAMQPTSSSGGVFLLTPHILSQQVISTDSFWTRICGIYQAKGGEEWLTIGNFLPDSALRIAPINPLLDTAERIYSNYYIDDVSVAPVLFPHASADTSVCTPNGFNLLLTGEGGGMHYL